MMNYYIIFDENNRRFDTVNAEVDAYAIAASIGGQVITVVAKSLQDACAMRCGIQNGMVVDYPPIFCEHCHGKLSGMVEVSTGICGQCKREHDRVLHPELFCVECGARLAALDIEFCSDCDPDGTE